MRQTEVWVDEAVLEREEFGSSARQKIRQRQAEPDDSLPLSYADYTIVA